MYKSIYELRITKTALIIFIAASLFYCYDYIIQVAPSAMTQVLMRDFATDATGLGLLASSFFWSYTLMQIPAGLMLDRYGSRLMLAGATFTCAIGTLLFAIAHCIALAMLGRILVGASGAFAFTGVIYLIIRWLPPGLMATFVGILQAMASVGAIIGSSTLAKILTANPWRPVMGLFGIIGIIAATVIWIYVRNAPPKFKAYQNIRPKILSPLKTIVKNSQTWIIAIYSFAIWGPIVAFAVLWGIPFLAKSFYLTPVQAANQMAMVWIGIAVGGPLVGWFSDKIKRRCLPLTLLALIGLFSSMFVIYDAHFSKLFVYLLLLFMGIATSGQTLAFGLIKDNNSINTASTASGLNNMAVVLSGVILQPLVGKLLDLNWSGAIAHGTRVYTLHDYRIALIIIPLCFLTSAITSMFFLKETHCQPSYELNNNEPR